MKNNKTFSLILAAAVMICAAVWFLDTGNTDKEPVMPSTVSASWSEHFDSVNEMEAAADIGIVGVLSDSKTEVRGSLVFTRNIVEVVAVHSGDVQIGDYVEVLQTGGEHGNMSTPAFSELPLMEVNKEYAMFLKKTPPHEKYGQYYVISGGYQGFVEIPAAEGARTMGNEVEFTDYFSKNFD